MRAIYLQLPRDRRPSYLRIAEAARQAIREGKARPGEIFPSSRALAQQVGTHRHTVMAAMEELVAEGWVEALPRKGYRVAEMLPSAYLPAPGRMAPRSAAEREFRIVRRVGCRLSESGGQRPAVPFASGMPDLRLFPMDELRSCLAESLRRLASPLLSYQDPAGHPPFREELKTYLRRVRAVTDREIFVTHGSQEGIFLAAQLLVAPGDAVAVEALGYPPAWEALKAAGARLIPIALDEEGMVPESLEKAARRQPLRLIYTTPLHQYPTTVTLTVPRRLALYRLATKHAIPILEDDYDHEFHYRCQPLPPLAAEDPAGLVIYVSTFSKILFPSARLGFMAVPNRLMPSLRGYRRILTRQNDCLMQDAVGRWMRNGGMERHLRRMRRRYEERLGAVLDEVERVRIPGLHCRPPDGGMAVWLETKRNSAAIAARAGRQGILVGAEADFCLPGRQAKAGTHLRLGFAHLTPEEIRRGLGKLFPLFEAKKRVAGTGQD